VEFTLQMNNMIDLVVCKEVVKMHPNLARRRTTKVKTHVHHILRDSGVKPVTGKEIFFRPLKIVRRVGVRVDMSEEVELAKNHLEQGAPLGVVVGLQVQCVRYKRLDVDVVDGLRHGNARGRAGGVGDESRSRGHAQC
jgi:hypothetical protein